MKNGSSTNVIQKDVVIIGNGPSGLALSYMLSGNIPYLISTNHPDEMLSARLHTLKTNSLVHQELGFLASGLEGRTTNPVSLLLDSLSHPYADIGFELDPLVEWRKDGVEIDHVVLGKGPPGGSWHQMDPCILTLSLGSWMSLPGLPYTGRDGLEKRASAGNVAQYYLQYVDEMNLGKRFISNICVTSTKQIKDCFSDLTVDEVFGESCEEFDRIRESASKNQWIKKIDENECDTTHYRNFEDDESSQCEQKRKKICSLSSAFNFIRLRSNRKCKRRRDAFTNNEHSPNRKIREVLPKSVCVNGNNDGHGFNSSIPDYKDPVILCKPPISTTTLSRAVQSKSRSLSFSCDFDNFKTSCERLCSRSYSDQSSFINPIRSSYSLDFNSSIMRVPQALNYCDMKYDTFRLKENCDPSTSPTMKRNKNRNDGTKWLIESYDTSTGMSVTYACKYLVLASGASDLPNRLTVASGDNDPNWLVHDVRSLELKLDGYMGTNASAPDPVLIIGAGLSAADAIIATRCRNIPVLHVFRNKTAGFGKQLPENMYPEYHKVHQMMQDGGSSYPLYTALPEYTVSEFNEANRTVKLTSAKLGEELKFQVSFAAVLIGSRPDLSFLPQQINLGKNKSAPVDNKTNNIDVNKLTHTVNGVDNLYAMGPLVGDNFVRFIPGGALAIVSDLYKKHNY